MVLVIPPVLMKSSLLCRFLLCMAVTFGLHPLSRGFRSSRAVKG